MSATKGLLIEYGLSLPPLVLSFDFNPESISRSRSITVQTGDLPATRGGYSFMTPFETARAAQGVTMQPETLSIRILLDATDGMDNGDLIPSKFGVQPQIDTLRSMVEPKVQGPAGLQLLSSLAGGGARAIGHREHASVLLFFWGHYLLPVFLTSITIEEKAHLPSLIPYRAEANLGMQVIESSNIFYNVEKIRQAVMTALNVVDEISAVI
jgi:Contractile injection system tube protein